MKRILAIGSIVALATIGFSGAAHAAPADAACFGQVHKTVNTMGFMDFENVGQLVKGLGGGQEKNAAANALFCSGE